MITLMLTALNQQGKVAPVLARYEAAMKAMPCYEVTAIFSNSSLPPVHSVMYVDHGKRLWYHAVGKDANYMLSIDAQDGYRELDYHARVYDQFSYRGDISVNTSRITGLFRTVPQWLRLTKLTYLIPKTANFTYAGTENVNGVRCDHLHARIVTQMGVAEVDVDVMPSGLVASYGSHIESAAENSSAKWVITSYKKNSSFPQSVFANPIPDGFVPYALDQADGPVVVDSKPSLGPWVDSSNGRHWSPQAGKAQLIVIAGQDSPPSDRALQSIRDWRAALAGSGVQLVVVSDATSAANAKGLLYDPTRKNLKALEPPSTPLFVLLDSKGAVKNLWLGFESSNGPKLLSDIREAAENLTK